MNDNAPVRELNDSAKRLSRYRLPLVLALVVNCFLVARIPCGQFLAARNPSNESTQVAQAPTDTETDSGTTTVTPSSDVTTPSNDVAPQTETADTNGWDTPDTNESDAAVNPMALAFQCVSNERFRQTAREWAGRTREMFQFPFSQPDWQPVSGALLEEPFHDPTDLASQRTDLEPTILPPTVSEGQLVPHVQQLVFHNPLENGGPVQFLLDRDLHVLLPGDALEWASAEECRVRYHRGGNFGNAEHWLAGGSYDFNVSDNGWELSPTP